MLLTQMNKLNYVTLPIWELIALLNRYDIRLNVGCIQIVLSQVLGGVEGGKLKH